MDDKFNEMKGKASEKADEAKERGGEMFNRDQEGREDDEQEQGGFLDEAKEKAQEGISKFKNRGNE